MNFMLSISFFHKIIIIYTFVSFNFSYNLVFTGIDLVDWLIDEGITNMLMKLLIMDGLY